MKVLLESSTESEWAARALEELGHEVIVADPNFAPMYATRNKMGEDRQARCRRLGAGLPAGRSSASAPSERCAAARADAALGEAVDGGIPQRVHRASGGAAAPVRVSPQERRGGQLPQ